MATSNSVLHSECVHCRQTLANEIKLHRTYVAPLLESMTASRNLEIHNVLHCCQRETELQ